MKYRKKPVVVEAWRWFEFGDVPEAEIEPYFWHKADDRDCEHCGVHLKHHGMLKTLEGWHIVCPGDYIIKGVEGEFYPCKPSIFDKTYEPVKDDISEEHF